MPSLCQRRAERLLLVLRSPSHLPLRWPQPFEWPDLSTFLLYFYQYKAKYPTRFTPVYVVRDDVVFNVLGKFRHLKEYRAWDP